MAGNNYTAVTRSAAAAKVQMVFGIVIFIFFGLFALLAGIIPMGITGIVIGVILICASNSRSKFIKLFRSYIAGISADPSKSIVTLASAQGTSLDIVKRNLQTMIKKGYFINVSIDDQKNCLVFGNEADVLQNTNTSQLTAEFETVACPGCGAPNKVQKGAGSKCEYCGAPLK
jgi:hypothetical protein